MTVPRPSSPDLERHTRAALDALLCLAGALREESPRAREDLGELRRAVTALALAGGEPLPEAAPHLGDLHETLGRMLGALWALDPDELARCLAVLDELVPAPREE